MYLLHEFEQAKVEFQGAKGQVAKKAALTTLATLLNEVKSEFCGLVGTFIVSVLFEVFGAPLNMVVGTLVSTKPGRDAMSYVTCPVMKFLMCSKEDDLSKLAESTTPASSDTSDSAKAGKQVFQRCSQSANPTQTLTP